MPEDHEPMPDCRGKQLVQRGPDTAEVVAAVRGPARLTLGVWGWREAFLTSGYLMVVVVAWGTNYPFLKLAIRDMPPLTFAAVRLFGGALIVAVLIGLQRTKTLMPPRHERLALASVGILQFTSVLGLSGIALLVLPAGRTVAMIYTMPLWAALFDVLLLRRQLSWTQILGIAVSLSGLLFFLDPAVLDWSGAGVIFGMVLAMLAAVLWGLGAVLYKARAWEAPLLSQTFWQLLTSGVVLILLAFAIEAPFESRFTPTLWVILVWNWLVPTSLAVWSWSKVLSRMTPSIAGQFLMCTPFVGIAASAMIFNEDLPPPFAMSTVLIVLGGLMVLIRRRPKASA